MALVKGGGGYRRTGRWEGLPKQETGFFVGSEARVKREAKAKLKRSNTYPARCVWCSKWVGVGEGLLWRGKKRGGWLVAHAGCYEKTTQRPPVKRLSLGEITLDA